MSRAILPNLLVQKLLEAGLMPENCTLIEVVIAADAIVTLRYERHLEAKDIERLGFALANSVIEDPNAI